MKELPPMTLLDYMVSSKENLILKAFLPYIDKDFQPFLATYIKYTELLATVNIFRQNENVFSDENTGDFPDIISALLPYVSEKERETFEMISNLKNTMEMFEEYKDIFAAAGFDEESSSETSDNDIADSLSSFLSPEQQQMFEQISSLMK